MRRKCTTIALVMICLLAVAALTHGQETSNYLILNNIGSFVASKNSSSVKGPGIVVGADHFYIDHADMTYRMSYFNTQTRVGPKVQVTQHTGGDSDKWLLHEVEDGYRDGEMATLGLVTEGAILRKIDTSKVFWIGLGGGSFTWISNNIVIKVSYTDLQGAKSEPLAVIQAYLQKFPSTIPAALVLDKNHDIQWIKDEMDRRLWLCGKWVSLIQPSDPKLNEKLNNVVDSMNVFLDYREKYYSIKAADEKNLLAGYLNQNDSASIQAKLTKYKTWWTSNKGTVITLP